MPTAARIDRARLLEFSFDGKKFQGFQGDTLRFGAARERRLPRRPQLQEVPPAARRDERRRQETNALVAVGEGGRLDTNSRATMVELYDGLIARSLNRWPSLGFDLGAINGWTRAARCVAGFYYKTVHVAAPAVAIALRAADPARGGDRRGADAARSRSLRQAAPALRCPGGRRRPLQAAPRRARQRRPASASSSATRAIPARSAVSRVLARTTVFGYYDDNFLCAVESDARRQRRLWHFRAKRSACSRPARTSGRSSSAATTSRA